MVVGKHVTFLKQAFFAADRHQNIYKLKGLDQEYLEGWKNYL